MMLRRAYRRLALILAIYTLLSLAQAVWLPLHKSSDELAHYHYIRFIAEAGRLPLTPVERASADYRANQPPLYHSLVALLTRWADSDQPPQVKVASQSARSVLVEMLLDTKRVVNTEDEALPYQGTMLMWRLGRLISIVLGAGTILVTFATALEIAPRQYHLATLAAALVAFIPNFIFTHAAITDDALTGLLVGLYFWQLVKLVKGDTRVSTLIWLGVWMGLSVTTKNAVVILPAEVVTVFAVLAFRQRNWRIWAQRLAIVALAAMFFSGWWYGTLLVYFNRIDELGLVAGLAKPLLAGGVNATENYLAYQLTGGTVGIGDSPELMGQPFSAWAVHLYQTFWVRDIGGYPLGPGVYWLAGAVSLISLGMLARRWRLDPDSRGWIALLLFHLLIFFIFPIIRHAIQGNVNQTAQGRHILIPAATIIPLLLVYGWPASLRRLVGLGVVAGLLTWTLMQVVHVVTFYQNTLLPIRTTPVEIAHPLNESMGDKLRLVGYETHLDDAALSVTLYWRSDAYPDEDYRRIITVGPLAWASQPLNGRYPTRIWEQGETIRDEIVLPLVDVPPDSYPVTVHLSGADGPLTAPYPLTEVTVPELPPFHPEIALPLTVDGEPVVTGLTLWQAKRYRALNWYEYTPRMVIPMVWQGDPTPGQRVAWLLVDAAGRTYPAEALSARVAAFTVGADWPTGAYRLRAEVWQTDGEAETVVASRETPPLLRIDNERPRRLEPPPIAHPLDINFAGRVTLLGYELPRRILNTGEPVPLTLYWRGERTMAQSYTVFVKLFDANQQQWAATERLPADGYPTFLWLENEVVVDGLALTPHTEPPLPAGVYWFNVGLYEEIDGRAVSLPRADTADTSVTLGPVKIGGPPPGILTHGDIAPEQPLAVDFGQRIRLHGYDMTHTAQMLRLQLYWESLTPLSRDYTVFVHLLHPAGDIAAQRDRPPLDGLYPTSVWEPGEIIPDTLTLPLDLPAGTYTLVVGLYDFHTGERLPLSEGRDSSTLTQVTVE